MANERAIWQFLRSKGLTPAQAAGTMGSLQQESGLSTSARNPSSGATGLAQWLGGRLTALQRRPNPRSLGTQLEHLWSELQGPERAALTRLKGAHSIPEAAEAFTWGFERPGRAEANIPNRVAQGRRLFNELKSTAPGAGDSGSSRSSRGTSSTRTTTETTPGTDNRVARLNLVQSFLEDQGADPVSFATGIQSLKDIPGTTTTSTVNTRTGARGDGGGGTDAIAGARGLAASAAKRATAIDRQRLPYKWGGGHGGQTKLTDPVPLDCSGAVSKVLGIDPRVADQFRSWGRPGDGGNKGVTVYSKPTHTLMKINGKFFGTSGTNPGGGAGWIPQSAMSPEYLSGFTARHSNR